MARTARRDEPGDWFHLMNRAVARRTLFESRADVELFLQFVGQAVERGWLEVHSYSVMATHFHIMARSPMRALSDALHHVQLSYVRYFNRSRRRDGPLVRGRFRSMLVESFEYRKNLVGYIDANAVHAGVVADAADYEFSSSHAYAVDGGPAWLSRDWVEGVVTGAFGSGEYSGGRYRELFHARFDDRVFAFVDRRSRSGQSDSDPTDSLLAGAAPEVLRWMRAKARLADGTRPGLPVLPTIVITETLAASAHESCVQDAKQSARLASLLLRELAGLTFSEIARISGVSGETARVHVAAARRTILQNPEVARSVARVGHAALVAFYRPRLGSPSTEVRGQVVV